METYQKKILQVVNHATQPISVTKIRKSCGIGNWNTALKHCLELLIQGRIRGQKTSGGWVFWAFQQINPQPYQEVVGNYETLADNEKEVSLIISRTPTSMRITFPKNSPEAKILTHNLKNTPRGTKIGILFTDNPHKPLITKILNETTVAHKDGWALLWLRRSMLCVAFKDFELVALKFTFTWFRLRS